MSQLGVWSLLSSSGFRARINVKIGAQIVKYSGLGFNVPIRV